jgi:hypothetical protein
VTASSESAAKVRRHRADERHMVVRQDNIKARVTTLRIVADCGTSTVRVPFATKLSLEGRTDVPDERTIELVTRCAA